MAGRCILLVVNVDWFFLSHRLSIAKAALDRGARVIIAAKDTGKASEIQKEGLIFVPIPLSRKGTNPIADLRTFWFLLQSYRRIKPALIHHVTIKPIIYGSLAARITKQNAIINTISGLGYSFSEGRLAVLLRPLVKILYRLALASRCGCTVFQNCNDRDEFVRMGLINPERAFVIRGSGVNCSKFKATPCPEVPSQIVVLCGRMLWDKGVGVFVDMARLVRTTRPDVRFALVGATDPDNPSAIDGAQLRAWTREGLIEWWGYREDMVGVLAGANIVALPSIHREGLPKILLEAAASARPIVASDVPGCREIVRHEVNGLLVPPGDSKALAAAITRILESSELQNKFGRAGREIVEREFAEEIVVEQTMNLYLEMLNGRWPTYGASCR